MTYQRIHILYQKSLEEEELERIVDEEMSNGQKISHRMKNLLKSSLQLGILGTAIGYLLGGYEGAQQGAITGLALGPFDRLLFPHHQDEYLGTREEVIESMYNDLEEYKCWRRRNFRIIGYVGMGIVMQPLALFTGIGMAQDIILKTQRRKKAKSILDQVNRNLENRALPYDSSLDEGPILEISPIS